jgi:uncharacterized BrkB/YihY/UPF0761 family membrane protein
MSEENELGPGLLKQDGLSVGEIIAEERRQLENLVQHEQRTSRLLMRIALVALAVMLISLLVVPLALVLMHLSGSGWGERVEEDWVLLTLPFNVTALASAVVAVVCGLFAFLHDRTARNKQISMHLANIEMLLRKPFDDT